MYKPYRKKNGANKSLFKPKPGETDANGARAYREYMKRIEQEYESRVKSLRDKMRSIDNKIRS